jgi:cation transport ATPase
MEKSNQTETKAASGSRMANWIAVLALGAIVLHLTLRYGPNITTEVYGHPLYQLPLFVALSLGGVPLVLTLLNKLLHREFGSDLLAGISIVTSVLLGEYLAGTLVVPATRRSWK